MMSQPHSAALVFLDPSRPHWHALTGKHSGKQPDKMKVVFACLADHASAEQVGGKLNVMGVFDSIRSSVFPVAHPKMFLVFRVMSDNPDSGQPGTARMRLRDDDNAELAELSIDFVAPTVPPGEFATHNFIMELVNVVFTRPGMYNFQVEVGGSKVEVPFSVAQA
jgi:hypothetical protein